MKKTTASKSAKKKIVKACKDGKVVATNPGALDALLNAVSIGQKPDFTVTSADFEMTPVIIRWGTKSAGFGEITFYRTDSGKLRCDSETMGKEFVREVLNKLLDVTTFNKK